MRPVIKYLLLAVAVAHLAGLALLIHFRSTGTTPHRYVSSGVEYLDRDGSPTRHIARFIRLTVLDSGLLSDPRGSELPPFPGPESWPEHATHKAGFRRLKVDEYGVPQQSVVGQFEPQAIDNVVRVSEVKAFELALRSAKAGDIITLSRGSIGLTDSGLSSAGTARQTDRSWSAQRPLVRSGSN